MSDAAAYVLILGLVVVPGLAGLLFGDALLRSLFEAQSLLLALPSP